MNSGSLYPDHDLNPRRTHGRAVGRDWFDHKVAEVGTARPPRSRALPDRAAERLVGQTTGDLLIERYLGDNDTAAVFVVRHPQLGAFALHVRWSATDASEFFWREARIGLRLHHPDIMGIHMTGEDAEVLADRPADTHAGVRAPGVLRWIATDLVPGMTLAHLREEFGSVLPPRIAVHAIIRVLESLAYAHANGIAHADIRPNLLVSPDGTTRITGFGRALVLDYCEPSPWPLSHIVGDYPSVFAAPEHWLAPDQMDNRADIFGTGLVLWQLPVGYHPLARPDDRRGDAHTIRTRICSPDIRILCRHEEAGIDHRLAAMVERDPDDRYRTAGEAARALSSWLTTMSNQQLPVVHLPEPGIGVREDKQPVVAIVIGDPDHPARRVLHDAFRSAGIKPLDVPDLRRLTDALTERAVSAILMDPDLGSSAAELVTDAYADGFDHVAAIRRRWTDVPIVIYSARMAHRDRLRGLMCGADRYLTRPRSALRIVTEFCHLLGRETDCAVVGSASETADIGSIIVRDSDGDL